MVIRGCPTSQGGQPGFPISTLPYTLSIIYTEYNIQCIWKDILYTHQPILTLPSLLHNRVAFKLPTHFANLHIPDQVTRLIPTFPNKLLFHFFAFLSSPSSHCTTYDSWSRKEKQKAGEEPESRLECAQTTLLSERSDGARAGGGVRRAAIMVVRLAQKMNRA